MRFPRFVWLLFGCAVTASPWAQAEPRRFDWQGPDCEASAPLFHQRLEELLDQADSQRLAGQVRVTRQGKPWLVEVAIELDGKQLGRRRFVATSCRQAAETAAVTASLAVFDSAEPKASTVGGGSGIWTSRAEPEPDVTTERPRAQPPEPRYVETRVGLLASAEVGSLPRPAFGGAVEGELAWRRRYSAALIGAVTTSQERRLGPEQQSAALRAFAATARGCVVTPVEKPAFRIDGCAGLRFMVVRGQGEGFDVNRSASLRWLAPLVGVNLSLRAPSFLEWRLELEASLPLSRQRFLVDGQELSRPAAVVLGVRLGPLVRFP